MAKLFSNYCDLIHIEYQTSGNFFFVLLVYNAPSFADPLVMTQLIILGSTQKHEKLTDK
jgi:hypothetical protein